MSTKMRSNLFVTSIALFLFCGFGQSLAQENTENQPAREQEFSFSVSEFNLVGPELVPRKTLQNILNQFTNRKITFSDLRLATLALEKAHAIEGFEVVQVLIPEQDFVQGSGLMLQIVDATLNNLLVEGAQVFDEAWVAKQLPSLEKNQPINTQQMDKEVRLLVSNPALQAKITLEPSFEARKVDAVIQVQDTQPSAAYFTLDNTGTKATGDFRAGLVYQHNNVYNKGHQFTGQVVTSPGHWSDVKVYSLNYKMPFPKKHSLFEVSYIDSSVNAGTFALSGSTLSVQGSGSQLAFKNSYFLNQIEGYDARLLFSYELKRFNSQVLIDGDANSLVPDVWSRPVGVGFSVKSLLNTHQLSAKVNYHMNIATGGNNSQAAYEAVKPGSNVDFALLKGAVSLTGPIDDYWRYKAELDFQFTGDSLVSGEQFGAGGIYSVRGFDERAVSADSGYRFSAEMQTPNLLQKPIGFLNTLKYVAFVDGAAFRSAAASQGNTAEPYILSYGAGLRFNLNPLQQIRTDFAKVVSGVEQQPHGDWMLHFSYTTAF